MRGLVALGATGMMMATALPAQAIVANAPMPTWETNGRVSVILRVGGVVYIGGTFTQIDNRSGTTIRRNHAAAFRATTGVPTGWNPNANAAVTALAATPDGRTIFAGGDFTRIGGQNHAHVAALGATTGSPKARWRGSANARVKAIVVSGARLILGGSFTTVGGQSRRSIGAVAVSTGRVLVWNPGGTDGYIRGMVAVGGRLVMCGTFENVGGRHEPFLAGITISSAKGYGWASHPNQFCIAVADDGINVYVGSRDNHFTRYDPTSGRRGWSQHGDGNVQAVAILRGVAYAGGHFAELGGGAEPHLAAFDAGNGHKIAWGGNANSNLGVFAADAGGNYLYIGGDFTRVNGRVQQGFAMFRT